MKKYAIIVAGGSGIRMGSEKPKQFLTLKDKPVLCHTIERFHSYDESINVIVVLPELHIEYWQHIQREYDFVIPHKVVTGGKDRFSSVYNGIQSIPSGDSVIAIHDGVRPLVTVNLIDRCFTSAGRFGSAIPIIAIADSMRRKEGDQYKTVNREEFFIVQTPQTFRSDVIIPAFEKAPHTDFTDDASVAEAAGHSLHFVEGEKWNLKITVPADLALAEAMG